MAAKYFIKLDSQAMIDEWRRRNSAGHDVSDWLIGMEAYEAFAVLTERLGRADTRALKEALEGVRDDPAAIVNVFYGRAATVLRGLDSSDREAERGRRHRFAPDIQDLRGLRSISAAAKSSRVLGYSGVPKIMASESV